MLKQQVIISNRLGLHTRASAKLINITEQFVCDIHLRKGDQVVDGKSIMDIMMLAASKGTILEIITDGPDEQQALAAIVKLIENRFDEEE